MLMFMDCTSSMGPWRDQAQKSIISIIDGVRQNCKTNALIRIAFIGYRDFDQNGKHDFQHMTLIDFTEDH